MSFDSPTRAASRTLCYILVCLAAATAVSADLQALVSDRLAVERVYYNHRLGTKPPFEQELPPALAEKLVRQDLHKEEVLTRVYGVQITPAMLDAEGARIHATSRAPEILAELDAALGHDPMRFAQTIARPIVAERVLRAHFENDQQLHLAQKQEAERTRNGMLNAKTNRVDYAQLLALLRRNHPEVTETAWRLDSPSATRLPDANPAEVRPRFGPEAKTLSAPEPAKPEFYLADLPRELQRVLNVQLRQPGDVSAVIETPGGFLLYLCKARNAEALTLAALSIPKRGYEAWLESQYVQR